MRFGALACTHAAELGFVIADEVNALVVDVGAYQCKAGYAGEDAPKVVLGTVRCLLMSADQVTGAQPICGNKAVLAFVS